MLESDNFHFFSINLIFASFESLDDLINSIIIPPCFISEGTVIKNSTIVPHVSIGFESEVLDSIISNSIIQDNSKIRNADIKKSMIGNNCQYDGTGQEINIGDFSELI